MRQRSSVAGAVLGLHWGIAPAPWLWPTGTHFPSRPRSSPAAAVSPWECSPTVPPGDGTLAASSRATAPPGPAGAQRGALRGHQRTRQILLEGPHQSPPPAGTSQRASGPPGERGFHWKSAVHGDCLHRSCPSACVTGAARVGWVCTEARQALGAGGHYIPAEAAAEESRGWWSPSHQQWVWHIPPRSFAVTGRTPEQGENAIPALLRARVSQG